jgi:DNA-damage-inducible protein J
MTFIAYLKKGVEHGDIAIKSRCQIEKKSDDLFQSLGLDTSTAIRIFLTFAIEKNGIPFDVRHAPEDLSLEKAISDTRKQENLHGPYSSAQEAVASMLED